MSRAFKIIFTGSLLLNLVLAGAGVGMAYKMKAHFLPSSQAVSPEIRQKLRQSMEENRAQMQPVFQEMRAGKQELKNIILAEDFDAAAYRKSAGHMLDLKDKIERRRALSMEKVLADLSQAEREKIARRFLDRLGNGPKRPSGYHRKAPPAGD
ncbi:MAG: periplasmic heavy metal sensor [Rhodospirillales bacterium]|nr:periplasmic heavy metal sensor [Alphaproteobacteria bacterium]USO03772.1 MAG: periplasmic heavy metal sensor [Rhodospirillales bacterium]